MFVCLCVALFVAYQYARTVRYTIEILYFTGTVRYGRYGVLRVIQSFYNFIGAGTGTVNGQIIVPYRTVQYCKI